MSITNRQKNLKNTIMTLTDKNRMMHRIVSDRPNNKTKKTAKKTEESGWPPRAGEKQTERVHKWTVA
jgi:hypothetical protein